VELKITNDEKALTDRQGLPGERALGSVSPVKQYALASILIVLGALVAVNFVSSRVERESVISRLETEALGPAKVSTFRIVEEISQIADPAAGMLLTLPDDTSLIDRTVLNALVGQQIARVDMLDTTGEIIYSTDPFYIGEDSEYAAGPLDATSNYVGAAAVSGLDGHTALIEAVITRVPVYREGRAPGSDSHEATVVWTWMGCASVAGGLTSTSTVVVVPSEVRVAKPT
jgi:hypothetical protein